MIFMTMYGLVTLALMIAFVGLVVWAYSPSQRKRFNQNANIPFIDELKNDSRVGSDRL
tara:strand:- start:62 stop:235 length:174 start_codon:yes stop_codon:yes gene_type:complete